MEGKYRVFTSLLIFRMKLKVDEVIDKCRYYRQLHNVSMAQIAESTGYTTSTVAAFEYHKNNNMILLLFYVKLFMPLDEIRTWKYDD